MAIPPLSPLETDRLLLRRPTEADAEAVFAFFGDPATNRHNPEGPWRDVAAVRDTLARTTQHWDSHGFGPWVVATRAMHEEIIGFGGLRWRDFAGVSRLNLGYRFATSAWGQGYATELARAAVTTAFTHALGDEVWALVRPANLASIRVLQRAGFAPIGCEDDVPGEAPSLVFRVSRVEGHCKEQV